MAWGTLTSQFRVLLLQEHLQLKLTLKDSIW